MDVALLMIRLIVGLTLVLHGWNHAFGGGKIPGTARWFESLGLRPGRLFYSYGVRNAILPQVTALALYFAKEDAAKQDQLLGVESSAMRRWPSPKRRSPSKEATKSYTESPLSRAPHFTRRFSADSLPRLGTISNVTLAPSGRPSRPAFSTAEIWTNTSLPPANLIVFGQCEQSLR